MRPPPDAVPAAQAAVLFAVIHQVRPTNRSVADATKFSPSYVHAQLVQLRSRGLVTWTEGTAGTLRSAVGFVVRRAP